MDNKTNTESMQRWDEFAEKYAESTKKHGDIHKEVFLTPNILALIGEVKDTRILDAGCGEGYLSRLLSERGAKVIAIDFSKQMIKYAKDRTKETDSIEFFQADLENLAKVNSNQFDTVTSNMVLQDVSDLEAALNEIYRVLKINGQFIFSILHPCFVTSKSGWEKDEKGEKLHFYVDQYFNEGQFEQRFGGKKPVFAYHRTLSHYINTLIKTGFVLEKVIEPMPSNEDLKKYPGFKDDLRITDFIIFKVKRGRNND